MRSPYPRIRGRLFSFHNSRDSQTQPHAMQTSLQFFWNTVILWEDKGLLFAPTFSAPSGVSVTRNRKASSATGVGNAVFPNAAQKIISSVWACGWLFQPSTGELVAACNDCNSVNSKKKILDYLSNVNQNLALQIKATESGSVASLGILLKDPLPIGTAGEVKKIIV